MGDWPCLRRTNSSDIPLCSGPGRQRAMRAMMSSKRSGFIERSSFCMPLLSNWTTPTVSPACSSRKVAGEALGAAGGVDQLPVRVVLAVGAGQVRDLLEGAVDGGAGGERDQLRDAVHLRDRDFEGAARIADGGAGGEGAERQDEGDVV